MDIEVLRDLVEMVSTQASSTGNGIVPKRWCKLVAFPYEDRVTLYGYPVKCEEQEECPEVSIFPHEVDGKDCEELVRIMNGRTNDLLRELARRYEPIQV